MEEGRRKDAAYTAHGAAMAEAGKEVAILKGKVNAVRAQQARARDA